MLRNGPPSRSRITRALRAASYWLDTGYSIKSCSVLDRAAMARVQNLAIPPSYLVLAVRAGRISLIEDYINLLIFAEGFTSAKSLSVLFDAPLDVLRNVGETKRSNKGKVGGFFSEDQFGFPRYQSPRTDMFAYGNRWEFTIIDPTVYPKFRVAIQGRMRIRRPYMSIFDLNLMHVAATEEYQQQLDLKEKGKYSNRLRQAFRLELLKGFGAYVACFAFLLFCMLLKYVWTHHVFMNVEASKASSEYHAVLLCCSTCG